MKPRRQKKKQVPAKRDPAAAPVNGGATKRWAELMKTPEGAQVIQAGMLPSLVYADQVAGLVGKDNPYHDSARHYVSDVLQRFKPRDPVEEMLVAQMMWTHMRLARLSIGAPKQQNVKWSQHMHEAADRAANTFRRQMLALAEYRNPRKAGGNSFTAIQQANIAHQQVVRQQNDGRGAQAQGPEKAKRENMGNEQGSAASPKQPQPRRAVARRRRHRLTAAELASLRVAAGCNQPWLGSTGPRTAAGKARSSRNAWRHGEYSAEAIAGRKAGTDVLRELRRMFLEEAQAGPD